MQTGWEEGTHRNKDGDQECREVFGQATLIFIVQVIRPAGKAEEVVIFSEANLLDSGR